jgi:hypothetical protein
MSKWLSIFNESSNSTTYAKIDKITKTAEFSNANISDKIAKIAKIRDENNFGNFDSFGRHTENYFKLFEERAARFEIEDSLPRTEAEYQAYLVILGDFILLNYPNIKREFDSLIFPGKAKCRK